LSNLIKRLGDNCDLGDLTDPDYKVLIFPELAFRAIAAHCIEDASAEHDRSVGSEGN
jgi:hypothetical protein